MKAIEDSLHRAKVQQLRAWAPFVEQLMTIFRHEMTEDQWTKWKNLESDMSSAMLAGYSESRLSRLETQLNEAKAKYDSLYHHTQLIVMDDDQPTSSRWQPTRKLRVRVARCAQLEKMLADTLGMPPTRPDEEEILVINECKLEQSESQAERLERATIPPAEAEPDSELDVKFDVDTTTSPHLEVSIAISSPIPGELLTNESVAEEDRLSTAKELIQNVEQEEVPEIDQQPEPEKEVEQLQQVEMQVEQQSQVVIEQADKQMSESQADVNQDLVQQQTSGQNIEPQLKSDEGVVMVQKPHLKEQKENELETDAEEDLTTKQRRKGFCSGNKSLFLNFNKLCNKLKSRRSHFSMSGSTNSIGSSTRKNVKDKETQIESKSVPQEAVDENTALSSLLVAQPCPPCYQQQQHLNAAGVGELLCAKTPLTTLDVPGVINCNSELGQQINQISLADASIPLITSETVPLPVATNDDYVITQSITKYYEGPIPAEINLSIEPRPTSSPPKEDRTQNAGNLEHSVATREELQESYLPISVALSQRIRDVLREQPAPSDTNQTISLTTLEEATINAPEANNNTSICTIFDTGFTAKNNENTEAKPNLAEEATADALQPNQQKLINLVKASKSAQSVAQLNADEIELPIAPAKLTVAGKQMVVSPRCHFVPKELRYKCGVPDCGQHFDSELGFSQHLSTQHYHGDSFMCPHCNFKNHSLTLEKVLEHLAYHKRYVYQCGACSSFATKFSIMDRHISKMHASKFGVDVDVIIHKRDDLTTHTKPTDVRWFKSVNVLRTSTDEWFCNLCPTALATEHQMIGHTELSHQRKHQYCCPYCDYGFKDPINIANHIRCSHAGKRIQPLQCYRRIKSYKPYTLGFICNTCHEATNTIRKMANHCQVAHSNRFQYKCRHCDFGHNNHHLVVAHMTQEHPGMPGLLIQQFDRLDNDMLDVDFWNKALIFLPKSRMEPPKPVETAQPEPVLPKLLVRLVPEPEQATQIESNSVPQEAVDENTALSSLLVAQPCPPCYQQQQQLNAAGVGELLCAKTPLTTLDVPGVINCNSELGQQINQISLADASIPLITSETVPLPVATNDDYVITQSIAKYYEGPIPAEINLSIEPRPTSSPPKEDRTQNAGNLEHSVATREELQESYLPTNNNTSICTIFDELLKDTGFTAKNNENTEAKPNLAEEATADALQPNQQKLINLVKASKSAQSVAQLNADEIELPIAPTKLTVAGKQMVVLPRCHFVPKELRYKCGVPDCGQHFDSELGFSQHLSTQHYHGDSFMCPHCNFKNHSLILEKVLEHLAYHKRYIYQCGACSSFATKFSIMDRHISKMHASKLGVDVDVIIHKRDDLTTHTRWFKSVNLRTSTDEWFCNLCPTTLATEHQMIGHAEMSHQRKHQYCCPYCDYGFKDPIKIVNHIRCSHAGKRIQPLQCYRRIKSYKPYTLGFICNTCHEATNTIRKMANHCQFAHSNRFQYKCRHCDFGHNNHHLVVAHMTQEHPGMPGLPIQQFDRLDNDMLDVDFWNKALIFLPKSRMEPPKPVAPTNHALAIQTFDPIEVSSDEDDRTYNAECAQKQYEFACSHCTETRRNIDELKSQHWAIKHPKQPFYFCVQPQLCCPVCFDFKGSAKALLEEHLLNVHYLRTLVACDVRQMRECGYCDKTYKGWPELVGHMTTEPHLANDLKNLTDSELNELIKLGSTENKYYQCHLCRVLMPSSVAIAQHGLDDHSGAERPFCFRLVEKNTIIFHCSFCKYASVDELRTLRHMLDHCKRFSKCHLCIEPLNNGFDEYIKHCYSNHRHQVNYFDVVHPYNELKKFLMQVRYQFQNGLIISKNSLRNTRFGHERVIQQLYKELRSKAAQIPFIQLQSRNLTAPQQVNTMTTTTPTETPRIQRHRKRLSTGEAAAPPQQRQILPTSSTVAAPPKPLPMLQRIAKRRNTYEDPGQLSTTSFLAKRPCL